MGQLSRSAGAFLVSVSLLACARPPAPPPAPAAAAFCAMRVDGNAVRDAGGGVVALRGANLPSLSELAAAGIDGPTRLRELAASGATIVRLSVSPREYSPVFSASKLTPFVKTAGALGVVVILAWDVTFDKYNDDQYDSAEEWLRDQIVYFGNNPGVWIEPIRGIRDTTPLRRRNVAQRLADILLGYRAVNPIVINDPWFLRESDPELNAPITGGNVVYGVSDLNDLAPAIRARLPLVVNAFAGDAAQLDPRIHAITAPDPARWAAAWKTSQACRP